MGPNETVRMHAELLGHWEIECADGTVSARNERISQALSTADEDDALGDALHSSAAMTVMPGDLQAWVDRGAGMDFLAKEGRRQ